MAREAGGGGGDGRRGQRSEEEAGRAGLMSGKGNCYKGHEVTGRLSLD